MSNATESSPHSAIALLEDATFQEEISFVWLPGVSAAEGAVGEQLEFFAAEQGVSGESPLTDFTLAETAPLSQMQDIADIDLADLIADVDELPDHQDVIFADLEIPGFETLENPPETGPEQAESASPFDQMSVDVAFTHATIVIDDDPAPDSVAF